MARLAVVLIIFAGLAATVSWQWSNISALYQFVRICDPGRPSSTATPTAQPKFPGRVPQDQTTPGARQARPAPQPGPAVAQRVVLYEEDPTIRRASAMSAPPIWRTETVSPGSGLRPNWRCAPTSKFPNAK